MFKQISKVVMDTFSSKSPLQNLEFIEQLFIAKYGSYEKAKEVLVDLKLCYPDDEDFTNAIAKEMHLDKFVKIMDTWKDVDSMQKLVEYKYKAESGNINFDISEQEVLKFYEFYTTAILVFPSMLKHTFPEITESLFVSEISNKVRFSIKEIRDEIGLGQRTFTKWLNHFFDTKYDGHKFVSLTEYIEIYQQLMLKEDEEKFDFVFGNDEYLKRINQGLVFSKEKLAELTCSDYKTLKANCENLVDDYKNWDLYPFRIAIKILDKMG